MTRWDSNTRSQQTSGRRRNPSNIMCIFGGRTEALYADGNAEALSHSLVFPQKSKNTSVCFRLSYPVHLVRVPYCSILSFVACLDLPYFSTLSCQRHNFREQNLLNIKYVFIFSTTQEFLILKTIQRDTAMNVHLSSSKSVFLNR